jgi:deoxyribodipyrimidine photo-lyase
MEDLLAAPDRLPAVPDLVSEPIPGDPCLGPNAFFVPGEEAAQLQLLEFMTYEDPTIYRYNDARDRLDRSGTSQLSPYLRFGMLSARQAVVHALNAAKTVADGVGAKGSRKGTDTWLTELIWREFYMAILYHFPDVLDQSFRPILRAIEWENDGEAFSAWCEGRTGYPVVDAAMRQLVQTGWMHNRARMIVASFLVKDLLVDWRWGERFFMQHLVDGDPAANNGGWQWSAGTGTDAAPYFRIFNPVLQGRKHDPEGAFVRTWLPELELLPSRHIHSPWEMSLELQRDANCLIGQDYPAPIIDHAWARQRTLAAYASARAVDDTQTRRRS